ncbi:MAG: transcriptional repressor [Spirochaetes bacterium]|nr:transcriptional repressor [Spirochaetota bacterium]
MKNLLYTGKKIKKTKARTIILEEINKIKSHPTAYEMFEIVKQRLPRVSLGTVYRNLDILSEHGLVLKLKMNDAQMHYDGRTDEHYHIQCVKCGKTEDIPLEMLKDIDTAVRDKTSYRILYHTISFYGLCTGCAEEDVSGKGKKV